MASKLFRAVVGVGISLGAASAACMGAVGEITSADDGGASPDAAGSSSQSPPSTPPSTTSGDDAGASSIDDAGVADVAVDAPKDAGPDAFCDAAWPTTKGNPGPPKCIDPDGECADAGAPERCWKHDAGECAFGGSWATSCVGAKWECPIGTIPAADCR